MTPTRSPFLRLNVIPWLSLFGAIAAAIFSIAVAWYAETRLSDFVSGELASRAIQQVRTNLASSLTEVDVEPPFSAQKLEEIAPRLDPSMPDLLSAESGLLRLHIYSRDGTVIYSDDPNRRGQKVPPARVPRLATALSGGVVTRLLAISSGDEGELGERHGEVLDVFGPIVLDGEVLGAFELYHDASPLRMVRTATWAIVVGVFTIFFLIYDRRREAQRQRLIEGLAEANALRNLDRLKTEMMTTVAHELRTPLSLIHGYAELLGHTRRTFQPDQVQEMAREIHRGSGTMKRIVEDLLDFGRIENGHLSLQLEDIDIRGVVEEAVQAFAAQPDYERIQLHNAGALIPTRIDRDRMKQIVGNLVTNAIRYAPTGPINVRTSLESAGQVLIEVSDEGPGIPADVLPRVWEMFYRGPSSVDSPTRGAGVGLPLVRNLVEAHGGTVEAVSTVGQGSTFRVRLPVLRETELAGSPEGRFTPALQPSL